MGFCMLSLYISMTAFATPVQSASLLCQPPDILITWLAASPRPIAAISMAVLDLARRTGCSGTLRAKPCQIQHHHRLLGRQAR